MKTITRVGYCPHCEQSRSPRGGQTFWAYGSDHKTYREIKAERNGRIGYVPTNYKAKLVGENVIVEKSCAMVGCGVGIKIINNEEWCYIKHWTREIWTIREWNALVGYKRDDDYFV